MEAASPEKAYSTDGGFKHLVLSGDLSHTAQCILPDRDRGGINDRGLLRLILFGSLSRSDRATLRTASETGICRHGRFDSSVL